MQLAEAIFKHLIKSTKNNLKKNNLSGWLVTVLSSHHIFINYHTAVRCAGLSHASRHLVGAAAKHALAWTTAMFHAETLAFGGGDAAHHGARLLSSAAVFAAIRRSRLCVGGASFKLARSVCTVLAADTTGYCTSGAAFLLAHFPFATAVLAAPASGCDGSGAVVERADLFGAVFPAHPSCCRQYP